jgi:hypothetical protein
MCDSSSHPGLSALKVYAFNVPLLLGQLFAIGTLAVVWNDGTNGYLVLELEHIICFRARSRACKQSSGGRTVAFGRSRKSLRAEHYRGEGTIGCDDLLCNEAV